MGRSVDGSMALQQKTVVGLVDDESAIGNDGQSHLGWIYVLCTLAYQTFGFKNLLFGGIIYMP